MPTPIIIMIFAWLAVIAWVSGIILVQRKHHPQSLFTLFFAELWERFSFYGMRALLVLYMTQALFDSMSQGAADEKAYGIYGAYGALVYGTPAIGGMLADRFLGYRKAIMLGAILMALGHFTMIFEQLTFFYSALALLIIGNGFFKPNISSLLGKLYGDNDPRRDSGFTIFYMGINVGAFLAPLTCGSIGELYGWHYGFGLAGLGMLLGLIVFWKGMNQLGDEGLPPNPQKLKENLFLGINREMIIIGGSFLVIPFFALLVNQNDFVSYLLGILGVIILGVLLFEAIWSQDKVGGQRIYVIIILAFFHTLFWAFFEQAGSSISLFTERNVDRMVMGSEIPTSTFQSVNPAFIILLAPLFSLIWVKLRQLKAEPYTPVKFALGIIQLGLGFGVFVLGGYYLADSNGLVPLFILVLGYLLHTTGELCLSPVGLSMITKLSPARIVGFVMGAWFLSISFAHNIASAVAKLTSVPSKGEGSETGEIAKQEGLLDSEKIQQLPEKALDRFDSLASYTSVFEQVGIIAVIAGLFLLILFPLLKKWMHGVH